MSARTYVVGLPVLVTVHDDGTVTYDVDTSEAGEAIRDDGEGPDAVVFADADVVDADHDRRNPISEN